MYGLDGPRCRAWLRRSLDLDTGLHLVVHVGLGQLRLDVSLVLVLGCDLGFGRRLRHVLDCDLRFRVGAELDSRLEFAHQVGLRFDVRRDLVTERDLPSDVSAASATYTGSASASTSRGRSGMGSTSASRPPHRTLASMRLLGARTVALDHLAVRRPDVELRRGLAPRCRRLEVPSGGTAYCDDRHRLGPRPATRPDVSAPSASELATSMSVSASARSSSHRGRLAPRPRSRRSK